MRRRLVTLALAVTVSAAVAWLLRSRSEPSPTAAATPRPPPSAASSVADPAPPPTASDNVTKITPAKILQDSAPPEREYLEQLSSLNHTDKQAALTWAEKGDEWYSHVGRNAEARRAMRVTLLVDLNRMDEARTFTREFIAQYPNSPYRRLVSGVTGIHPRPSGPRAPAAAVTTPAP